MKNHKKFELCGDLHDFFDSLDKDIVPVQSVRQAVTDLFDNHDSDVDGAGNLT
jgi:hypothetical protein